MYRSYLEQRIVKYLEQKSIKYKYEEILFCFYPKPKSRFKVNRLKMPYVRKIIYSNRNVNYNNINKHYLTDFVIQYYGLHIIETKGKICANSRAKRDQLMKHFNIYTVFVKEQWYLEQYLRKVEAKAKELNIMKDSDIWWRVKV